MNELSTKEDVNIVKLNKEIDRYLANLNFCKELSKIDINFNSLYIEIQNSKPRTVCGYLHGIEDLRNSPYEYKLKIAFIESIFSTFNLADFMNFEQKDRMRSDIKIIAKDFIVTFKNTLSLVQSYINNADKVVYDSVTAIAGKLTDRRSHYKTNSKAFKFSDKHILEMGLSEFSHYRNDHVMLDVQKVHNLFYGSSVIKNRWHNFVKWKNGKPIPEILELSENLSIKVFKNKNMHILLSNDFQNRLNKLIGKNILK